VSPPAVGAPETKIQRATGPRTTGPEAGRKLLARVQQRPHPWTSGGHPRKEKVNQLAGDFVSGGSPSRTPTFQIFLATSATNDQFRELLSTWPAVLAATITLLLQYWASNWVRNQHRHGLLISCCRAHQRLLQGLRPVRILDLVAAIVLMPQPRSFALAYALATLLVPLIGAGVWQRRACSCIKRTSQASPLTRADGHHAPKHAGRTCSRTDCHGCYHNQAPNKAAVDTAELLNSVHLEREFGRENSALLPGVTALSENLPVPSCSKDRSEGDVRVTSQHKGQEEADASASRPSRRVSTRAAIVLCLEVSLAAVLTASQEQLFIRCDTACLLDCVSQPGLSGMVSTAMAALQHHSCQLAHVTVATLLWAAKLLAQRSPNLKLIIQLLLVTSVLIAHYKRSLLKRRVRRLMAKLCREPPQPTVNPATNPPSEEGQETWTHAPCTESLQHQIAIRIGNLL